jgi:hypothetical protein
MRRLDSQSAIGNRKSTISSLSFFVTRVLTATAAEFTKFQTISRGLLVLRRYIVAALAIRALQYNVVSRHVCLIPISDCQFPISTRRLNP